MRKYFEKSPGVSNKTRFLLPILTFVAVLVLDRLSKEASLETLRGAGRTVLIPGILGLQYTENTGMAFGLFSSLPWLLFGLRIVGLLFLAFYLFSGHMQKPLGYLGLAMAVAGGISNVLDAILYGYVVDMIEFLFVKFAIFNVADSFITVGAVLIGIYFVFLHRFQKKETESDEKHDEENSDPE
ncbi:MAG: signal peptidase II [Clostridia bacterium]|nr:signal peptidase II [Clostridia bacterium]